jgi:hypothetical protein
MNTTQLRVGQVIQLHPENTRNRMFAACLMVVTEPKGWGAQGFVQSLGQDGQPGGQAYYRANWAEIVHLEGMYGDAVAYMPGYEESAHDSDVKSITG